MMTVGSLGSHIQYLKTEIQRSCPSAKEMDGFDQKGISKKVNLHEFDGEHKQ